MRIIIIQNQFKLRMEIFSQNALFCISFKENFSGIRLFIKRINYQDLKSFFFFIATFYCKVGQLRIIFRKNIKIWQLIDKNKLLNFFSFSAIPSFSFLNATVDNVDLTSFCVLKSHKIRKLKSIFFKKDTF